MQTRTTVSNILPETNSSGATNQSNCQPEITGTEVTLSVAEWVVQSTDQYQNEGL